MEQIGGAWKAPILWRLKDNTMRYGELRKDIPHISDKMLTTQLRQLEEDGYIVRKVYAVVPPKTEYSFNRTTQGSHQTYNNCQELWAKNDRKTRLEEVTAHYISFIRADDYRRARYCPSFFKGLLPVSIFHTRCFLSLSASSKYIFQLNLKVKKLNSCTQKIYQKQLNFPLIFFFQLISDNLIVRHPNPEYKIKLKAETTLLFVKNRQKRKQS